MAREATDDSRGRARLVCQVEAVLDTYARPYDCNRPVVGLDEKRKQLVQETRTGFTDACDVRHVNYKYERGKVGVLYMLCEPLGACREVLLEASKVFDPFSLRFFFQFGGVTG